MQPMERIDKDIREKLQGYEATPSPRVWEGILAQQAKQNQTRRILWIAGLVTAAAIAIGIVLWSMRGDDVSLLDDHQASDIASSTEISRTAAQTDRTSAENSVKDDATAVAEMPTAINTTASTQASAVTSAGPLAESNQTVRNKSKSTVNKTASNKSTNNTQAIFTDQVDAVENSTDASMVGNSAIKEEKDRDVLMDVTDQGAELKREQKRENKFSLGGTQSTNPDAEMIQEAVAREAEKPATGQVQGIGSANEDIDYAVLMPRWSMPAVSALPSLLEQKQEASEKGLTMSSLQRRLNSYGCELNLFTDCYRHDPPSSRLYMDMYYNQVFGAFQYSTDNLELQSIADRRTAAENVTSGYGFGMRFSSFIENKVMVRAGLEYSKIKEDFLIVDEERIITGRTITIDSSYNPGTMQWEEERDTVLQFEVNRTRSEYENTYEFLDIPLEIGYQWTRKRWSLSAYGGVIVNLAFDKKGATLNDMGTIIRYDGDNIDGEEIYRTKVGLSLSSSLQAAYAVAPTADVFIEPHMRYTLSPITMPDQTIRKRFYATGVRAGVRFRL